MTWQLYSGEQPVGVAGTEIGLPNAHVRSWPLQPNREFERIRPTIDAMGAGLGTPVIPRSVTGIRPPGQRIAAIEEWLTTRPEAQRRRDIFAEFRALDLRLVDENGRMLDSWMVTVAEIPRPSVSVESRMATDLWESEFGGPPFYMIVALIDEPQLVAQTEHGPPGPRPSA